MQLSTLDQKAIEILNTALAAVDPYRLIHNRIRRQADHLILPGDLRLDLKSFDHLHLIGMGKSVAAMARALEEILKDSLSGGQIIVKYGHTDRLAKVIQHQAGHPLPDENTLKASKRLLEFTTEFSSRDLVFALISGGGSALLESLPDEVSLSDLKELNRLLLVCAASIHEINCIRKHVSAVKGGQLARFLAPARGVTLILSDVVGDDISVIASGPTVPDQTTYGDAIRILQKYQILTQVPGSITTHLEKGFSGLIPETPKTGDKIFERMHNILIGNNKLALTTAEKKAIELGFHTSVLTSGVQGPVEEVAEKITGIIRDIQGNDTPVRKPACVLLGGEPVVRVEGKGKGGRNQHLALLVANLLRENKKPYLFLSCGTDGTDGFTDAAGAIVTSITHSRAAEQGLNIKEFIENYDAYNFFTPLDLLIKTGPTRTNVMDVMIVIVP